MAKQEQPISEFWCRLYPELRRLESGEELREIERRFRKQRVARRRGRIVVLTIGVTAALARHLKDINDPEKLAEAESVAQEAASLARTVRGDGDQLRQDILDTLAFVLYTRGKHEEAVVLFEEIADARRKKVGEDGWHKGMSAVTYGRCLMALKRYKEAEAVLLAVYNDGEDDSAREALVDLYMVWGKPDNAAEYGSLLREGERADEASE